MAGVNSRKLSVDTQERALRKLRQLEALASLVFVGCVRQDRKAPLIKFRVRYAVANTPYGSKLQQKWEYLPLNPPFSPEFPQKNAYLLNLQPVQL